jgi:phosphoribosylformylglycinamidine (FGAM) synthase-like enzyme
MKDPTRGGLASALHEMAAKSGVGVVLDEVSVPRSAEVAAAAELLGIDPLHVANEGKVVLGVRPAGAERVLAALRSHPLGRHAAIVGTAIAERAGLVILDTGFGSAAHRLDGDRCRASADHRKEDATMNTDEHRSDRFRIPRACFVLSWISVHQCSSVAIVF